MDGGTVPDAKGFDRRVALRLLGIFVGVVLLWNTPVVAPLKIFVVLLHEISHGVAAVLTGGSIESDIATSDASKLAELTHLPAMLWGFTWIVVAVAVTSLCIWLSVRRPSDPI